ncbi:MAG TPA: SDR family oxidoreductase [Thermoanaerobaculia bacterium]|jgi:3-oxoacyl-[acyl-carrier protein] reductase|nr:SDR family oxidoreductase [Thermoanaerobaculia bacterium]
MSDLTGRVALITGASSGLGFAAARAIAGRGARVAIASRGEEKLEAARERLQGSEVIAVPADVRDADSLSRLVEEVGRRLGPIDILVANGGGPPAKPALEVTEEDWQVAIPLALLFVPRLCRLVLPGMRERHWGRIVAINSVSSRQPIPGLALSNALRPAVLGYLKTLSQEVAGEGVTVNAVLPGYTLTERQDELANSAAARTGRTREEIIAGWIGGTPAGRMAEPDEIGAMVGFLCSPEASYVTGQAVTVDGGYVKGLM